MIVDSKFSSKVCRLCADVCEWCAEQCDQRDHELQGLSRILQSMFERVPDNSRLNFKI